MSIFYVLYIIFRGHRKLQLHNFQASQVSSFDFSTLYMSLPYDLIQAKVFSHFKVEHPQGMNRQLLQS